ncbi:tetratricopeptide repeat protein, partial [Thermoplasmatales archaeon ex4484_30]
YLKLASVTNTKENLIKAIEAYKEALKVRTIETHPDGYATTQNNLGTAYLKLASVTNTKENLIKAIEAYKEALKVNPVKYFLLQKALGDAYYRLSLLENDENISKALGAYQKFLEIETELGAYMHLQQMCAEVKNKIKMIMEKEKRC